MTPPPRQSLRLLAWGPNPRFPVAALHGASTANALVITRHLALGDETGGKDGRRQAPPRIAQWAVTTNLGASPDGVKARATRRALHATRLNSAVAPPSRHVATATIRTEGRLVPGLGDRRAAHDLSIVMDGTYGFPYLPGSGLKGVTSAWARSTGQDATLRQQVFGRAPTSVDDDGAKGQVVFHDALLDDPPHVITDVLTPHPADNANPIPVTFLALADTRFTLMLAGPDGLTQQAMQWLIAALDTLGFGAKTAAGYGYLVESR